MDLPISPEHRRLLEALQDFYEVAQAYPYEGERIRPTNIDVFEAGLRALALKALSDWPENPGSTHPLAGEIQERRKEVVRALQAVRENHPRFPIWLA